MTSVVTLAESLFLLSLCVTLYHISSAQVLDLLYYDKTEQLDNQAGIFGLAIDPLDQAVYAWAQGRGGCGRPASDTLDAFLIKFPSNMVNILWCAVYDGAVGNKSAGNIHFWTGNNGPVIDFNGDIYVIGNYFENTDRGTFLIRYNRGGQLASVLKDDRGLGSERAAGLAIDIKARFLYAVTSNYRMGQSSISRFDLRDFNLQQKENLAAIWSGFSLIPFAIALNDDILYGTGYEIDSRSAFLMALNARNFTAFIQYPALINATKYAVGVSLAIDPEVNALYMAGTTNWFSSSSLWKFNLTNLNLLQATENSSRECKKFVFVDPVTHFAYSAYGSSILQLTLNGSTVTVAEMKKDSYFYSAAMNSSGYLFMGGGVASVQTNATVKNAIFGYQGM